MVHQIGTVVQGSASFEMVLENALAQVNQTHADILSLLTGSPSMEEVGTWTAKELAARAYISGDAIASQIELIETEAGIAQTDPSQLCQVIIGKADQFRKIVGIAGGLRKATKDALNLCGTAEEIDQVIQNAETQMGQYLAQITASNPASDT